MRLIEPVTAERSTPTERRCWTARISGAHEGAAVRVSCWVRRRPSGRGRWPSQWEAETVREVPLDVWRDLSHALLAQVTRAIDEAMGVEL